MPTYTYKCTNEKCDEMVDIFHKITESLPSMTCSNCGNTEFKQIISGSSFILRGSGWFKDGY